jgi:beta-glucosidase/6-phospho-beta-glucosidase/beta-galactosidase
VKATLGSLLDNYTFTAEQKAMIQGSCDFYAIDGYTGYLATGIDGSAACAANSSNGNFPECAGSSLVAADGFPLGPSADNYVGWLYSTPTAIRKFLNVLTKDLFPSIPDIVVSEFGFAEPFEGDQNSLSTILWDLRRADYYQSFLDNILAAKVVDGVNVTGAFGWAAYDNFEWFEGSHVKFGLQYLNQTSLERFPKASMFQFLDWFKLYGGASLGTGSVGGNVSAIPNAS